VWGPLHGVGVTIEDIHATAGMRSTFGGYRPFADHVPAVDATVVARLKAAGAIVVGKTNGPCIWGQESVFLPTLNPGMLTASREAHRRARLWRWRRG
jgi:amidase